MKPRSRRYAGTRGLARPAAAGYLLYFRCRFDTLDQGSRIPIKVQLKTGSSTQPRVDAARPAVHVQQQTRFATTLTRGPSGFDSWGICNVVHTFRVWARPSGRSLAHKAIWIFEELAPHFPPGAPYVQQKRRNSHHIFGAELRVKPAPRVRAVS